MQQLSISQGHKHQHSQMGHGGQWHKLDGAAATGWQEMHCSSLLMMQQLVKERAQTSADILPRCRIACIFSCSSSTNQHNTMSTPPIISHGTLALHGQAK
jgi:hypothetical protein